MDTEKAKALLKALELGSLSAAAEDLGYSPSGISRMMASLEEEIGFRLLIRSRNGLIETEECRKLLPYIKTVAEDAGRMENIVSEILGIERGTVTVGTPYPEFYKPLAALMAAFSKKHPGIHLLLTEGMSTDLARMVSERSVDFCIISERDGDYDWIPLVEDPLVAMVAMDNPLAEKGFVTPEDLAAEPFILLHPEVDTDSSRYLTKHNIGKNVRFSCRDIYAAHHLVEAGLGITVDNAIFAEQFGGSVSILPLEPPHMVTIGIATPHREMLSPAAMKFKKMAKEFFPI